MMSQKMFDVLAIQDAFYPQNFKKFVSKFEASKISKFSKTSLCSKSIYMGNEPEKNLKEKKINTIKI